MPPQWIPTHVVTFPKKSASSFNLPNIAVGHKLDEMLTQTKARPPSGSYFLLVGSGMSGFPGAGFTAVSLCGILSLPWSPFASLPPEVDVPLPLLLCPIPEVS